MAKKAKELGSVKRFGARYGRNVKVKLAKIEAEQKRKKVCPFCKALKIKRQSAGIWYCEKCGAKFTGRAYTPGDRILIKKRSPVTTKKAEEKAPVEKVEKKVKKEKVKGEGEE